MSTIKKVSPLCFGTSGSVLVTNRPHLAKCPRVVQTFCPLTIYPSPSSTALVDKLAKSEPEPGSENIWHQISSVVNIGLKYLEICSGVPYSIIVGAPIPIPRMFATLFC